MNSIKTRLYSVISSTFGESLDSINDGIGPGDFPRWDSLGQIQLISAVEKEFETKLSVDQVMSIYSVGDLLAILNELESESSEGDSTDAKADSPSFGGILTIRQAAVCHYGSGAIAKLGSTVKAKNIVVVTGEYSSSHVDEIKTVVGSAKVSVIQKAAGEPTESEILNVALQIKASQPDLIIALGGGSVIDISKLAWAIYEYPELTIDDLLKPFSLPALGIKAKFLAIPTLFGSGAEVSSAATFNREGSCAKSISLCHDYIPCEVILDGRLSSSVSLRTVIMGIFDALTHSIEGYVSTIDNMLVEEIAIKSVMGLLQALQQIKEEGGVNDFILDKIALASYQAGIVQNHCSVGLTHSIAHQLSAYNISHANATALLLLPVMKHNSKTCDAYTRLASSCGFDSVEVMLEVIGDLLNHFELSFLDANKASIRNNLSLIVSGSKEDLTFKTNPSIVTDEEIKAILESVL